MPFRIVLGPDQVLSLLRGHGTSPRFAQGFLLTTCNAGSDSERIPLCTGVSGEKSLSLYMASELRSWGVEGDYLALAR